MYSYGKLKMLRFSDILGHAFLNYCTHPKIDNWIQFTFQKGLSVNLRECISFWTVNDGIPYWLQNRSVILSFPPAQHTHRSFFWLHCTTECCFALGDKVGRTEILCVFARYEDSPCRNTSPIALSLWHYRTGNERNGRWLQRCPDVYRPK
jgi:hypothetical protein